MLTSEFVIGAVWHEGAAQPVLQQVMINCTEEDVMLVEGEVIGWIEESRGVKSMQEVLQEVLRQHEGTQVMYDECVARAERINEEAIDHEPQFDLP